MDTTINIQYTALQAFRSELCKWIVKRVNEFTNMHDPHLTTTHEHWAPVHFRLVKAAFNESDNVLSFIYTNNGSFLIKVDMTHIPKISVSLDLMFMQYVVAKMEQIMSSDDVIDTAKKAQRHVNNKIKSMQLMYTQN